jgi:hypothetical protein
LLLGRGLNPLVGEGLLRGHPQLGVWLEETLDELLGFVRDFAPLRIMEFVVTQLYLPEEQLVGVGIEGRIATEEAVGDYSDAPHVTSLIICAFQDFRSHVIWSAYSSFHEAWEALLP